MHPDYLKTVANVTWYEDTNLWVTSTRVTLDNIWYFASRTSPIYRARRMNATGSLPIDLPALREQDIIFMPNAKTYLSENSGDWARHFLQVATGLKSPRVEHPLTEWGKLATTASVQCFRNVVLTGAFGFVVRTVACWAYLPLLSLLSLQLVVLLAACCLLLVACWVLLVAVVAVVAVVVAITVIVFDVIVFAVDCDRAGLCRLYPERGAFSWRAIQSSHLSLLHTCCLSLLGLLLVGP